MAYIKVVGLSQFNRDVRRASASEPAEVRKALLGISQLVASRAQVKMQSLIHDHRSTGQLVSSLKPRATTKTASIVLGTPVRTPYGGWWEYGGPRHRTNRPPNRTYIKEGRALYPTLAENTDEIWLLTERVITHLVNTIEFGVR